MIPMRCKTCGGNILPAGDGTHGVCESCGNTFLLPRAQQEETSQPSPAALDGQEGYGDKDAALGKLIQGIQAVADQNAVLEGNATSADEAKQEEPCEFPAPERAQAHESMKTDPRQNLLGYVIILLAVILLIYILYNSQRTEDRYQKAINAYYAHDYSTATELFISVKNYEDAPKRLLLAKYLYGGQLISSGEYTSAVLLLKDDLEDNKIWGLYRTIPIKYRYVPGDAFFFGKRPDAHSDILPENRLVWQVLAVEDDQFLVISYRALDCIPFDVEGASAWETGNLRAWLNSDFMDAAFVPSQQRFILPTALQPDTTDYLFLLSAEELSKYRHILDVKDTRTGIRPAMWMDGNATGL